MNTTINSFHTHNHILCVAQNSLCTFTYNHVLVNFKTIGKFLLFFDNQKFRIKYYFYRVQEKWTNKN